MTNPADTTQVDIRIRKLLEGMITRKLEDELYLETRIDGIVGDAILAALYTTLVQQ